MVNCMPANLVLNLISRWWFQIFLIFIPILGKIFQFDYSNILQMGWNHQLEMVGSEFRRCELHQFSVVFFFGVLYPNGDFQAGEFCLDFLEFSRFGFPRRVCFFLHQGSLKRTARLWKWPSQNINGSMEGMDPLFWRCSKGHASV